MWNTSPTKPQIDTNTTQQEQTDTDKNNQLLNRLHVDLYTDIKNDSKNKYATDIAEQYATLQAQQLSYIKPPVPLFKSTVPIKPTQSNKLYKQYNGADINATQRIIYLTTQIDAYTASISDGKKLLKKLQSDRTRTIDTVHSSITLLRRCMCLNQVNILLQLLHSYNQLCDNYTNTVHTSLILLKDQLALIQSNVDELSGLNDMTNTLPTLQHKIFYLPQQLLLDDAQVQQHCTERINLESQFNTLKTQYTATTKQTYKTDAMDKNKRMNTALQQMYTFNKLNHKHIREFNIELEFSCIILDERHKLGSMLAQWLAAIEQYNVTNDNVMTVHNIIHSFLIKLYRGIANDYNVTHELRDTLKILIYRILFPLMSHTINKLTTHDTDITEHTKLLTQKLQTMYSNTAEQLGVPTHFTPATVLESPKRQHADCHCTCHTITHDIVDTAVNDKTLSIDTTATNESTKSPQTPLRSLTSRIVNYFTPTKSTPQTVDTSYTAPNSRVTSPTKSTQNTPIKHRIRSYTDQPLDSIKQRRNSDPIQFINKSPVKSRDSLWNVDKWLNDFDESILTSKSYIEPFSPNIHDDSLVLLLRKTTLSPSISISFNKSHTTSNADTQCCKCNEPIEIRAYNTAIDTMNELCRLHSPIDMLNCLLYVIKLVYESAKHYAVQHNKTNLDITADSLFPIMSYVIVQCNNTNLIKQIKLMQLYTCTDYNLLAQQSPSIVDNYSTDKTLPSLSESAYYLTMLDSVTHYIMLNSGSTVRRQSTSS